MGPRSDNRGYVRPLCRGQAWFTMLQWVHGRITVVMPAAAVFRSAEEEASMGPRSDNRGYGADSDLTERRI